MCCVEIYTTSFAMVETFIFRQKDVALQLLYAKEMNARILPPIN